MENKNKRFQKWTLYIVILALAVTSVTYKFLEHMRWEQTTLLFVGLPALISFLIIRFSNSPKTLWGIVMRTITLFLLMSGILLGEDMACILIAAPLFYGIGALLVFIWHFLQKRNKDKMYAWVAVPLLLVVGEAYLGNSAPALQTVTTTKVMEGQLSLDALNQSPNLGVDLPFFFHLGFPTPHELSGEGIEIGDERIIPFESTTKGMGELKLRVKARTPNRVVFELVSDDTHIAHWLRWEEVTVEVQPRTDNTTLVSWTTDFYCDLGPRWYFEKVERYAVELNNEHLLDHFFGK